MEQVTTIGLDLAKLVFQVHGVDRNSRTGLRKTLRRKQVAPFFAQLPPCLIGMESCPGAHYWARLFEAQGHTVRLMPPRYVKPYVKTHKSDAADAEAICEAVRRPNMRFVPVKNAEQQAILAVHRVREGYVKARTALSNQIRGLLAEYGLVLPKGIAKLQQIPALLDESELPGVFKALMQMQLEQLHTLQQCIARTDAMIQHWCQENPACQRLQAIPGVGVITATAMVASVGDARCFRNGRQLAAWMGLVPNQHSTGGQAKLGHITKRGDVYLRTLVIHGARAVIR
ncbi:MAG: IS110 family transposase, partial [Burkholderia sp.]|nr:IS110 family transposase [Burkholderia sp.]